MSPSHDLALCTYDRLTKCQSVESNGREGLEHKNNPDIGEYESSTRMVI